MRLRSTQFVFLLLLICTVQLGEDYTRQLTAEAPALLSANTIRPERTRIAVLIPRPAAHQRAARTAVLTTISFRRELPAMTHPASSAAALQNHTSLLRA